VLGYSLSLINTDYLLYTIVGFAFFFTLAIPLMNGQIEYKAASTTNMTTTGLTTSATTTYDYTPFDDSTSSFFGKFMAIIGVLGTSYVFYNWRLSRREDDGEKWE
jgi:hypothetical protein